MAKLIRSFGIVLPLLFIPVLLLSVLLGVNRAAAQPLLFLSRDGAAHKISMLDVERGLQHLLLPDGDFPTRGALVWSPDGTRLAFVSRQEVYVMDAGGRNVRNISNSEGADWFPSWSPDSRQITFVSHRDGNQEIYVADLEANRLRNITNNSANDSLPAWSPDGTTIAFHSQRENEYSLYTLNADGRHLRRLTEYCGNLPPAWSADSQQIMFCSYC
jgi:Tol biopolymer transport system component